MDAVHNHSGEELSCQILIYECLNMSAFGALGIRPDIPEPAPTLTNYFQPMGIKFLDLKEVFE